MAATLIEHCIVPQWPVAEAVRALFTTRTGGVSRGTYASLNLGERVGDDPAAVAENRARLRRVLPNEPFWLKQVHGSRVVAATSGAAPLPEADAAVTRERGVPLAIQTADCLAVLLADRPGTVVAAAHAGWRGLAGGVLESTVSAMAVPPEALVAFLGPAIGPRRFEVGGEVRAAFIAADPGAGAAFTAGGAGKWLADLCGLARLRLAAAGVGQVYGGNWCTVEQPELWFSHRRDKPSGRMAALIWRA